jgi:signal transduction histidine kinase/CheY-like chemotaxis protein
MIYIAVTTGLIASILYLKTFPVCFIAGKGLTPFKITSEYIICVLLVGSIALLYRRRNHFDVLVFRQILCALVIMIGMELCFTLYVSDTMSDAFNEIGHLLKICVFYLVYKAIVVTALRDPVHLLFRELAASERNLRERTTDLVLARDAAEAANKAKSAFLANMSHELRTPLNAILGFSNIMRREPDTTRGQREKLDVINRSGEHLLALINDVLEVAKIEAGRVQLADAPFDLGGMMRDVTDMMQVRAAEKGLRLQTDQSSKFPRYIVGDEARLRQVLINLIGNAVKFTEAGGVTVRLGTKQNSSSHLIIEVEDSGPGIAPEDQQRVFEPFVQLGALADNKGTGLGLTITRQFVRLMKGTLTLESTPGKGTLFRIDLPLRQAEESDISTLHRADERDVTGLAPGQPDWRILIVEDQLENQLLLANLMESVGFQIKVAENGRQGVELFQTWRPHFIWMDRLMPVMDGIEATKAIRGLPGGNEVKIVAVTASAFEEQREGVLEAGMDDFVRKPYRADEIYECLSRQLGVRYAYLAHDKPAEASMELAPEALSVLPEALRRELEAALESLESERIEIVVGQVARYDKELFRSLTRLAQEFDYPAILKALRTN